jgi:hypothetical protein
VFRCLIDAGRRSTGAIRRNLLEMVSASNAARNGGA